MNNFKLRLNGYEEVEIEPNYNNYRTSEPDAICLSIINDGECSSVSLNSEQLKEVIKYISEVVEYIESKLSIGDNVNIIGGKFKGLSGKVYDIDTVASRRAVTVEIEKTSENDKFYVFVDKDNLEFNTK